MSAQAAPIDVTELARLGVLQGTAALLPSRAVLRLDWPELENALPDHGLPRGVVEIAALPRLHGKASPSICPESMRGGATSIALAAMRAAQAADEHAWCAWVTPAHPGMPSLYAPALVQAGIDLERLLVVRPSPQALARTVLKVAASGAFAVLVVDVPHRQDLGGRASAKQHGVAHDAGAVVVRKLALAAEENGTMSLLLTSALMPRSVPWPVAMRLEVERRPDALSVRVTKDRRGGGSSAQVVRLLDPTELHWDRGRGGGAPFGVSPERSEGEPLGYGAKPHQDRGRGGGAPFGVSPERSEGEPLGYGAKPHRDREEPCEFVR